MTEKTLLAMAHIIDSIKVLASSYIFCSDSEKVFHLEEKNNMQPDLFF